VTDATKPMDRPAFGPQGEPCANCGALLARDQRYCLECGTRRAGMGALLSEPPDPRRPPTPPAAGRTLVEQPPPLAEPAWRLDAGLLAGVGCLLLALLVGVLIGRSGDGDSRKTAAPQVVTVAGPAGGGTAAAAATPAAFRSDWPAGKRGFTVQLQSLSKAGTGSAAVAAAKKAASAKGAPAVGALDSDAYSSLDPGSYVIYSGQYPTRKAAKAPLAQLKKRFPGATVVEVAAQAQRTGSSGGGTSGGGKAKAPSKAEQAAGSKAIQDIQNATGKDYSKKSAKLPKTLVTPGAPPPKDNKPAGGGSGTETFK
jgi:SPOR domain